VDHKTLEALNASIAHWEDLTEIEDLSNAHIGRNDCALCTVFNNAKAEPGTNCNGCPIYERTKVKFCGDTPHEDVSTVLGLWEPGVADEKIMLRQFRHGALKEVEFLRSLLPEDAP
jgi:hypothetical protein